MVRREKTPTKAARRSAVHSAAAVVGTSKPRLWSRLGAGLITGAADDDPSGIATYSQAGAQFGFQLSWTLLLTFPLMVAIQFISARIGRTTGRGIAGNLRQYYPGWVLQPTVILLFLANTLNLGADLSAMAEASRLLLPGPGWIYVVGYGAICIFGQVWFQHTRYVAVLKWLTLSLLAYVATVLVVHVPWPAFLKGLLWPTFTHERGFWLMIVAVLGTTISPYLFFWQAAQEVEDTKAVPLEKPLLKDPKQAPAALARIRLDTIVGMALSNVIALAIMVTCAATLHEHSVHSVDTAAQAAESLRPIAGNLAFALFALGIVGTGLLSVPVLAGSAAYALGEARRWPVGLARKPRQAKAFYTTIAVATILGATMHLLAINPLKALVWSAVINGVVAVPIMALLMLMSARTDIMGTFVIERGWLVVGWLATALMFMASVAMIMSPS